MLYQRPKKVVLDKLVRVVIEDEADGGGKVRRTTRRVGRTRRGGER